MQSDNTFNEALACHQAGQVDQAAKLYRLILNADGRHPQAFNNLGAIFMSCGRLNDAIDCFQNAINACADFFEAHLNLARAYQKLGDLGRAVASFRSVLRIKPEHVPAYVDLSFLYHKLDNDSAAISCCLQALERDPLSVDACNNLGNALSSIGDFPAAIASFNRALQIQPQRADLYYNLANAQKGALQVQASIENYRRALVLEPEYVDARWNLSHALLLSGNFQEGWHEYECRFMRPNWKDVYPYRLSGPRWEGSPFEGRQLLIHDEQGLGDTLQFLRYLPMTKALGGKVIFEVRGKLLPLLKNVSGADEVVQRSTDGKPNADYDLFVPLLSLPAIFGTLLQTVPDQIPYLFADNDLVCFWAARLSSIAGLKVGICWQGNPAYTADRRRSVPLKLFEPLARIQGIQLISLQKIHGLEQLAEMPADVSIIDLGRELDENTGVFMDTAAVLKNLDLVITSDTALPHLAGALGVPVWLLLPYSPEWRWLTKGSHSPWYPTMRLYRQPDTGNWKAVFQRVSQHLTQMAARN